MKLVFGQECQPIHAILLVFPKLCLDLDRNMVRFYLTAVEKLCQELTLVISPFQKLFRETNGIWKTSLCRVR